MDPVVLAGMLFVLIILAMVGGFILLLPITRRLGALMEHRLGDKGVTGVSVAEVRQLTDAVRALQADVDRLAERQEFTESLLGERDAPRLPRSEENR